MKAALLLSTLLAGCGGLSPLSDGPASTSDDTGDTEVVVGELSVSPAAVDFGTVEVGATASEQLVLTNTSDGPLIVKEPLVTGDYGFEVDTTSLTFPVELEASAETVLSIEYTPVEEAEHSGQLLLRVDGVEETATVDLSGAGGTDVGGDDGGSDGGDDGGGDAFEVDTQSIDFGIVDIGTTAAESIIVTNNTSVDILVTEIASTDDVFQIGGEISPPQVISAGDDKYITVAYSPEAEVVSSATVTITTDSAEAPSTDVSVTGEGYQPCTICAPIITVDTGGDDSHSVGMSDLSCNASATLTVQNEGDEPLEIQDVEYSNDTLFPCGTFSVSWGGAETLDPWATTTIDVDFTATEFCIEFANSAADENMLHILSNDPAESDYAIELTASVTCLW